MMENDVSSRWVIKIMKKEGGYSMNIVDDNALRLASSAKTIGLKAITTL